MIPWHFPRDNLKSSSCLQISRSFASWFGGCDPQVAITQFLLLFATMIHLARGYDIHLLARVTPPSLLEYALDECFVVLQMVPGARLIMA